MAESTALTYEPLPRRVIDKDALVPLRAGVEADLALKLPGQDIFDKE